MMTPLLNSFTVGTDLLSLTIRDNVTGAVVALDGKKDMWEAQASDELIKGTPIDGGGVPDHRVLANGWTGSIRAERQNGNFGAFYAFLEQNYYSGGGQHYCTVIATIQTPDGSDVERMQYSNLVFHGYRPGSYEKTTMVKSEVSWACARRDPV